MDYTMDTLSLEDVRVCDMKHATQGSNFEGVPCKKEFIPVSREQEGSQHQSEVGLLSASSPLHLSYCTGKEPRIMGTNAGVSEGYGLDPDLLAGVAYETQREIQAQLEEKSDGSNVLGSDSINRKTTLNQQPPYYTDQDNKTLKSVASGHQQFSEMPSLTYVDNLEQLTTVGVRVNDKLTTPRLGGLDSAMYDFMAESSQSKERQYDVMSLQECTQFNETDRSKNDHFQSENCDYCRDLPHDSQFVDVGFQSPQRFVNEAKNVIFRDSSGANAKGVFGHDTVEIGFGNSLRSSENVDGPSVPIDSQGLTERLESAAVAAVLTSLQEQGMVRKGQNLGRSQAIEQDAGVAESGSRIQNDGNSGQRSHPRSGKFEEDDLCMLNSETNRMEQDGLNYPDHAQENDKPQMCKQENEEEQAVFGEAAKVSGFSKSVYEDKTIDNDDMQCDTEIEDGDEKMNEDDSDTEEEETAKSAHGEKDVHEKSSPEEDAVSVQSVDSPPPPPPPKPDPLRKFVCNFCNKTWKLRKELNRHLKTHTMARRFACSLCNSNFVNRTLLKKHLLMHTEGKSFPCPECPTSFSSVMELKKHQRVHVNPQTFACSECSYTTGRRKNLTKHMVVHFATKIYTCHFCKFSSKRNYSLQRHLKTAHSSAKIYKCTVCNFQTGANDSFKVHVAMHVSTNTTSCIICGTVIKKKPCLVEHLLSHSSDEDAKCKECDQNFSTIQEYMLHLLSHKNRAEPHLGSAQDSEFDLDSSSLLNGSADSTSGVFGFLARKSKVIMDTPTMEAKLSQMSTVASRLADMTKVVTLLNEKSKVVFQLAEISTLATELAIISGNVLQSYKSAYGVAARNKNAKTKPSGSNDAAEESSFADEDDDHEEAPNINIPATAIKEEIQDSLYSAAEAGMQIQVDFDGEPVSCVQKDEPYEPGSSLKSKGERFLKCNRCNLTFTDTRSLKRHRMAHDDVRPYSCEKCGQSFRRNEHLKKHMVTHSDERPFVCKECPYAAKTEHRLKIHILCHTQNKAFGCQHCTYTARTNYELNHHVKRHELRSCTQCNFICYSRSELKKHVFTHSSFGCSECEYTTNDRAEYTKHIKKHSIVQHLCCELCGYSCDTMKKFKYHKLRHENKTPYQCADCDYKCSSRASFDCHRLKHAGLKPYLCSFCGSSFRKTSHLNQHLLIHKDEKAFKCSECGYSCRTKHNLKEHEMTHSGEKPFACKYCNFSCRRNKALQLHMLKHESHAMMIPQLQLPGMQLPHLMSMMSSGP